MHYAEFAEDEVSTCCFVNIHTSVLMGKKSAALLAAIKEYDANKWKAIGQKVGKPAKVSVGPLPCLGVRWGQELTETRLVSSMQRSILVGSTEDSLITTCIVPDSARGAFLRYHLSCSDWACEGHASDKQPAGTLGRLVGFSAVECAEASKGLY
jgi:hypothetical protein